MTNKTTLKYNNWFLFAAITVSIFGIYYRLSSLGSWGFTSADEYYMAVSVKNILKHGLPQFETGGFYTRGILYQYLSALFVTVGLKDVLALRLVAVLASIASMPAVYLLAKKVGGKTIAITALFLYVFSTWEVEYARFSRYYTLFQAFFLWHLYFTYEVIVNKRKDYFKVMLVLSFFGIFAYEGGIFLVIINFFPFFIDYKNQNKTNIVFTIIVFAIALIFIKTNFRLINVKDYLPLDVIPPALERKGTVYLPPLLVKTLHGLSIWTIGFVSLFFVWLGSIVKVFKESELNFTSKFGLTVALFLLLFNQIGLSFLVMLILYLGDWIDVKAIKVNYKIILGFTVISLLFWTVLMFNTNEWQLFYKDLNSFSIKKVFWTLFNYPDIYQQIILPWVRPIPRVTIIIYGFIFSFLTIVLWKDYKQKKHLENKGYKFLLLVLLAMIIGVAAIITPYHVGRYTFFIHPLFLILFTYSSYSLIKIFIKNEKYISIIFAIVILLTLFVSKDYSFTHFKNIDTQKEHFKEGYEKHQATMYYLREDYITPADYVNEHKQDSDLIISTIAPCSYYLDRLDFYYRDYNDIEFPIRSRELGKRELWTNAPLKYKEDELLNNLENRNKTIWFITYSPNRYYAKGLILKVYELYKKKLVFSNLNKTINVYKLDIN